MQTKLKILGGELGLFIAAGNVLTLEAQEPEVEQSAQLELAIRPEEAEIFASQLMAYAKIAKERRL